MPRSMVGLLAAVGTAMSALAGLVHSGLLWMMIAFAATAMGLAACFALPGRKKAASCMQGATPRGLFINGLSQPSSQLRRLT